MKRKKDFKLASVHGLLIPDTEEARIRNTLFYRGLIQILFSRNLEICVRLFAYEVPVETSEIKGVPRVESVDLLGYDTDKNLYIIELKTASSKDSLDKTVTQIRKYEQKIHLSWIALQAEFRQKLQIPEFTFVKEEIKKIILAPKEYYRKNKKTNATGCTDILFCYFAYDRNKTRMNALNSEKPMLENSVTNIAVYKGISEREKG